MSSKPNLRLGPDQDVADGVLERRRALTELVGDPGDTLFVSGLAGSKDDVLHVVGADSPAAFTLSGAMGAAVAMGLGLALAQPDRKVMVVTGDGELLMNVGTLATVGVLNPPNLSIICVDNEHYGETGWQKVILDVAWTSRKWRKAVKFRTFEPSPKKRNWSKRHKCYARATARRSFS